MEGTTIMNEDQKEKLQGYVLILAIFTIGFCVGVIIFRLFI